MCDPEFICKMKIYTKKDYYKFMLRNHSDKLTNKTEDEKKKLEEMVIKVSSCDEKPNRP